MPPVTCTNHPARDAIGLCVRCRARVCSECSTKVDGINHCVGCLAAQASAPRPPPVDHGAGVRPRAAAAESLSAAVSIAALGVLVWVLIEGAFP